MSLTLELWHMALGLSALCAGFGLIYLQSKRKTNELTAWRTTVDSRIARNGELIDDLLFLGCHKAVFWVLFYS